MPRASFADFPGDPASVARFAQSLRELAGALDVVAGEVTAASGRVAQWGGLAGPAWRERAGRLVAVARRSSVEFGAAAGMVQAYGVVLARSQEVGRWARAEFDVGAELARLLLVARMDPAPGLSRCARAEWTYLTAESSLRAARAPVLEVLRVLPQLAAPNPSILDRPGWHLHRLGSGLLEAVGGLVAAVAVLEPARAWTDPDGFAADWALVRHGFGEAFQSWDRAVGTVLDAATWDDSPARWLGHLASWALPARGWALWRGAEAGAAAGAAAGVGAGADVGGAGAHVLVDATGLARVVRPLDAPVLVTDASTEAGLGAIRYADLSVEPPPPAPVYPPGEAWAEGYANRYGTSGEGSAGILMTQHEEGAISYVITATKDTPPGQQMFAEAIANFHDPRQILGLWTPDMPANLDAFNRATAAGLPIEQAAWLTFGGKMAAGQGMTEVLLHPATTGEPGSFSRVWLQFAKPDPLLVVPPAGAGPHLVVDGAGTATLLRPLDPPSYVTGAPPSPGPGAVPYADLSAPPPPPVRDYPPGSLVGDRYVHHYGTHRAGITAESLAGLLWYTVDATPETPSGFEMAREALSHFPDAKGIVGNWMPDLPANLNAFNAAVRAGVPTDQAAWLTFAGKVAQQVGMREVDLWMLSGPPGDYDRVLLAYLRDKPDTAWPTP